MYSYTFAASYPDSFQVEVDPPTFKVNQAVDMKITAIKDGEVMKDYEGSFSIYVTEDNNLLQSHEATVPEGGW
ncbi:hypothetical protein IJU97_00690 [bacterium]|nr:hypothetical protein [bacterium]